MIDDSLKTRALSAKAALGCCLVNERRLKADVIGTVNQFIGGLLEAPSETGWALVPLTTAAPAGVGITTRLVPWIGPATLGVVVLQATVSLGSLIQQQTALETATLLSEAIGRTLDKRVSLCEMCIRSKLFPQPDGPRRKRLVKSRN